jgi:hypothetical protein
MYIVIITLRGKSGLKLTLVELGLWSDVNELSHSATEAPIGLNLRLDASLLRIHHY